MKGVVLRRALAPAPHRSSRGVARLHRLRRPRLAAIILKPVFQPATYLHVSPNWSTSSYKFTQETWRKIFSEKRHEIGDTLAGSESATSDERHRGSPRACARARARARSVRASWRLLLRLCGNQRELLPLVEQALSCSPHTLIDRDLRE